jgi:hypothetical protein
MLRAGIIMHGGIGMNLCIYGYDLLMVTAIAMIYNRNFNDQNIHVRYSSTLQSDRKTANLPFPKTTTLAY